MTDIPGALTNYYHWGPTEFWVSEENGYSFTWSCGALVIIVGELGSKLTVLGI